MNKTIYKQYDSRWGNKPYPTYGSSFSGNGCGCCACTHLVIEQDRYKNYTPENLRPWMIDQGFAYPNQGTTWNGIKLTLEHYGYTVTHIGINDPMSKAWTELNKKNRIGIILFLGGSGPNGTVWTAGGHYIAFTDYKVENGKHYMYMKDSGGRDHDGWYSYENSMRGLVYQMWIVEKINTKPSPTPTPTPTPTPSKLVVDGVFGPASVKAAQKLFNRQQDGVISGQYASLKQYHKGFSNSSISYGSTGSGLVRAIQTYLKLDNPDGQLGPKTIRALQTMLKMSNVDGVWGPNTSKAFQTWLNANSKLPPYNPTPTPGKTKIKGMDISTWQGKCSVADFKKAKASGIQFVILRVGFTGTESRKPTLDNCFENNYANAKAAGLKIGYYYYTTATNEAMAEAEAKFTLAHIKGKQCDYPVYFDIEDPQYQGKLSPSVLAKLCNKFCDIVNKAGYKAGVYASTSWFNNKIGKITASHTKWVAQYYKECQYKGDYDMWQYTSSETVPGIGNNIDMNWCYKKF